MKILRFILASLLLCVFALSSQATIIQDTNRIAWTPGVTVGSRATIGGNTHVVPITGLDFTGTNDCSVAINAAIQAAAAGDVLYISNGWYRISAPVYMNRSDITLRGQSTNCILFGSPTTVGGNAALGSPPTVNVMNGYTKGSSSLACDTATGLTIGDVCRITTQNPPTNELKVISSLGFEGMLAQTVIITSISGTNIGISPPLVWNFNHSPTLAAVAAASVNSILFGARTNIGIESIKFTFKDPTTGSFFTGSTYTFLFTMQTCYDSWATNCAFEYPDNYAVSLEDCVFITFRGNRIQYSQGVGTSHTGIILAHVSGCLIENNILADTGQGGLMFNTGFTGNAIFANYFTNTGQTILMHQVHPMMNLFEENTGDFLELDGYYGSNSHETLFRNSFDGYYAALLLKRWSTYIQVVGNVLGWPGGPSVWMSTNDGVGAQIVQIGYPNIGNNTYSNSTLSTAWNNPQGVARQFTTTATTNIIWGDFSFVPAYSGGNYSGAIFNNSGGSANFDDPVSTRFSWSTATSTNLTLLQSFPLIGTFTFYVIGPSYYQQRQAYDIDTDNITANYDYAGNAIRYNSNPDHFLEASLLYTSGQPDWWGTNRWPAINVTNAVMVTEIPALSRALGKGSSTNFYILTLSTNGAGTIAKSPSASTYADGTVVAVTATANSGNTFTGWSGDIGGSVNPTNITMSASKSITGNFQTNSTAVVTTRIIFH